MTPVSPIGILQPRGQCIILLIAALKDAGVSLSRREAVELIGANRWFALQAEDWKPYPSQKTLREARWKTLIAWARKDAVLRTFVNDFEHNSWSLSRNGHRLWEGLSKKLTLGEIDVSQGYLWSAVFKRKLCPGYLPSEKDARRPCSLYRDSFERFFLADQNHYCAPFGS
jgi:hypothetical protein